MKVLIAAAGTGGHINPGIAIANKIKEKNPKAQIIFVGTNRGLENDLVPRAGYELKRIEAYGFSSSLSIKNIQNMFKTLKGYGQAKKLIKDLNPDLVIGTGGYIGGPVGLAAIKNKIPTVFHESNAYPGITVKMLSKKADKILLGFEETKEKFPKAKKLVFTGTPTKFKGIKLTKAEKESKIKELGLKSNMPVVLVYGGSQGAQAINETILGIIKNKMNSSYQILWASGPKQYDIIKEKLENDRININNIENVKILPYIYNMEEVIQIADLLVCRSGAMTITEIAISGRPAIFIPLPSVSANRQEDNARALEKVDAARVILNQDVNENRLNSLINELLADGNKLKQMGENAKKLATYNVEDKIYDEIKGYLEKASK